MHRTLTRGGVWGSAAFPAGKMPLHGEIFCGMYVAHKQHGMGADVEGKRFSHQPSGFEPGVAHQALTAGQCCGGRYGADAQNGGAVSRAAALAPSAAGGRNRPPAGRRTRAANR